MQSSNERSLIDLHEKAFTNLSPFSLTILYVCTSILCVIKQFSQITLNINIIHNTYQVYKTEQYSVYRNCKTKLELLKKHSWSALLTKQASKRYSFFKSQCHSVRKCWLGFCESFRGGIWHSVTTCIIYAQVPAALILPPCCVSPHQSSCIFMRKKRIIDLQMHLCSLSHWSDDDTLNEEDDQEGGKNTYKRSSA